MTVFNPTHSQFIDKCIEQTDRNIQREIDKKVETIVNRLEYMQRQLETNTTFYESELKHLKQIRDYVKRKKYLPNSYRYHLNQIELLFEIFGKEGQPKNRVKRINP